MNLLCAVKTMRPLRSTARCRSLVFAILAVLCPSIYSLPSSKGHAPRFARASQPKLHSQGQHEQFGNSCVMRENKVKCGLNELRGGGHKCVEATLLDIVRHFAPLGSSLSCHATPPAARATSNDWLAICRADSRLLAGQWHTSDCSRRYSSKNFRCARGQGCTARQLP